MAEIDFGVELGGADRRGSNLERSERTRARAEITLRGTQPSTTRPNRPRKTPFVVCAFEVGFIQINDLRAASVELEWIGWRAIGPS